MKLSAVPAIAVKDLRLLLRDKPSFFFAFFWPVLLAVFFGSIFSGSQETSQIRVLVVDLDQSNGSRAFIERLAQNPELSVSSSDDDAGEAVRRGRAVAAVTVPAGFGEASSNPFFGEAPEVTLQSDPSRVAEAGLLEGLLLKTGAEALQELMQDPDQMSELLAQGRSAIGQLPGGEEGPLAELFSSLERVQRETGGGLGGMGGFARDPLEIRREKVERSRRGPSNGWAVSFPQGMIWAILGSAAAFGISLALERVRGTLRRLQTSPIGAAEILIGKGLACFCVSVGLGGALVALARFGFGVNPTSLPLLLLALVSSSFAFVGIMMLLSVLGRTEQAAGGIGWAVLLIFAMLGGGMVPLFIMPTWMQQLSKFSPVRWAILAIEGGMWRSFTLGEMVFPCAVLGLIGIVSMVLGVLAFRVME